MKFELLVVLAVAVQVTHSSPHKRCKPKGVYDNGMAPSAGSPSEEGSVRGISAGARPLSNANAETKVSGTRGSGAGPTIRAVPGPTTRAPVVPSSDIAQFTPNQADWSRLNGVGVDHSPLDSWPEWDEVVVNPNGLSGEEINAAACKGGLVKGMQKAVPTPFADPINPLKKEVDEYNVQVIRQVSSHL
jgi:hypothetical protein